MGTLSLAKTNTPYLSQMELLTAIYLFSFFYIAFLMYKRAIQKRDQCCYMLHYECYKPPEDRKLTIESVGNIAFRNKRIGVEEFRYIIKTLSSSGVGDSTYAPKTVLEGREASPSLYDSVDEIEEIIFDTLDKLFDNTKGTISISPSEIDILVVNVSLLSAVPSLTSRVVNRYKMREDIKTYNLTGMGCSAGLIGVNVIQQLFKVHRNVNALVVSTENMGSQWYMGTDRSFVLSYLLFRTGGCAMLFTNNTRLKHRALIKLNCMSRTHLAGSDHEAYTCCHQIEDDEGNLGCRLTKYLPTAAGIALTANLKALVPRMLPMKEILRHLIVSHTWNKKDGLNFKAGVQHFCIHPGGRAVIDGAAKGLQLSEYDVEPTRMALRKWGNTSSSGIWYVFGYMQAKKRLKKGDKILMISLGAGFKCNSCLWEVMRPDLNDPNVWEDCDHYPPKSNLCPFMDKYNWIFDESLNFARLH